MGGVAGSQDCLEFLAAGASVVGVGTALFADPGLPRRIVAELPELLARHGADGVSDLVGAAHPRISSSSRA
jgi:dihydroorotate dehydrogenase (NAD+) catalytic subunit